MSRVENVSSTKRIIIYTVFILFSVIFLGIIFAFTTEYSTEQTDDLNYSTWLVIAYLAGLSMIVLPCTLPFVFIIVPMTIDKGYKKGLTIALLFGMGMTATITLYGLALALLGKTAGLNNISGILMLLAGTISFLFGFHRLQLINIKLPSYSGTPKFMLERGDYSKAGLMGLLVGNAGVGCTNPLFYIMLIYIMGTGSPEIGTSLGFVHGIGRAIPLILVAVLAMIGFNPARKLVTKRAKIEKMSGFLMIILGSFLIINGIPEGQQWYMEVFFHSTWNEFVEVANLPEQFSVQMLPEEFVTGTGQPSLPPSSMEEMQHEDMENLEPDKINVLTTKNDWNLYFWWEPREELQVNNDIIFNIMFFEPQTQTMTKKNITYDLEVYQNNILLESRTNIQNTAGHDMQQFKFSKEGGAVVKIKNINGVDTEGEFSLEVSTKIEHTTHNQNKFQPRFPLEFVPVFTGLLIVFPIIWYTVKNKKKELGI